MTSAQWHTAPRAAGGVDDPFATPAKSEPREDSTSSRGTASTVDVVRGVFPCQDHAVAGRTNASPPLAELIDAEVLLAAQGTTCHLKDEDWTRPTCIKCPERGSKGSLCMIGVAQQKALTEMGQ